jgi:hypothetical protein
MGFDGDAEFDEGGHYFAADVLHGVHGRGGEVPFLEAHLVAEVGGIFVATSPDAFAGADVVLGEVDSLVVPGVIEDEELQFGAKIGGIGDLGLPEVIDGFAGDGTGIAGILFFGDRSKFAYINLNMLIN